MLKGPAETRTMETTILSKQVRFCYSGTWVGYTVSGGRVIMGWSC